MFGIAGVVVTSVASGRMGGLNAGVLVVSLPIALVSGLVLTRATANGIAKLVPSTSGKAASHKDLVGCKGVVISSRVTGEFGEVRLTDPAGRTIRLICRANEGEEEIGEGAEVVVTEWDRERDRIYVSSLAGLLKGK
jgi:membrane protein implicated in regulation of membrane protease activity